MKPADFARQIWFRLTIAGLAVFALESWQIGRPSLWADEVATISASHRTLGHLLRLLTQIDAVHGAYYLLIHFLGQLLGFGPFALRLPSAIAVSLAVVFTFLLAKKLFGERLAWFALVVSALLPRLAWAATEARSYAIDALLGVLILYFFVLALNSDRKTAKRYWVGYVITLAFGIHFFVYIALYAGAQGIWLLFHQRREFARWILALGVAIAASGYLIVWAIMEKGQIAWLPPVDWSTPYEVFVGQAFWGDIALAFLANGLILAVIFGARHTSRETLPNEASNIRLLTISMALPPAIILLYSLIGDSIYDSRYFSYSAPVVAILLALAVDRLFSKRTAFVALALVVGLSFQGYHSFRNLNSKGDYWTQVAAEIQKTSAPGDAILYTDYDRKSPSISRLTIAYPQELKNVTDVTVKTPYSRALGLYPKRVAAETLAPSIWNKYRRVVVVSASTERKQANQLGEMLKNRGFALDHRLRVFDTTLAYYRSAK